MYKRILVGIDDGETAEIIFQKAVTLAQLTHAELLLLSVLVPPDRLHPPISSPLSEENKTAEDKHTEYKQSVIAVDDSVWSVYQSLYKNYELRDLNRLETFVKRAKAAAVIAEVSQRSGRPGRVICDRARDWQADLVMVGSHGRMGLSEMLLGSVSNYVTHHATCSVLVVHDLNLASADLASEDLAGTEVDRDELSGVV